MSSKQRPGAFEPDFLHPGAAACVGLIERIRERLDSVRDELFTEQERNDENAFRAWAECLRVCYMDLFCPGRLGFREVVHHAVHSTARRLRKTPAFDELSRPKLREAARRLLADELDPWILEAYGADLARVMTGTLSRSIASFSKGTRVLDVLAEFAVSRAVARRHLDVGPDLQKVLEDVFPT